MFEVRVEGWFAAAHRLRLRDGSLEPLHGHNWRVRVTCAGAELDEMDVLADFTRLQPALAAILAQLHDRCLNDVADLGGRNPSAERVAVYIAERMRAALPAGVVLARVEVEESPGCVACYVPSRRARSDAGRSC